MDRNAPTSSVLIVDDSLENIDLLVGALPDTYRFRFSLNGEQALEMLSDRDDGLPDIILLDVMMPGMDGFEVCARLKETPFLSYIPVIFLSAKTDVDFKIRAFTCGAVDYITKPFNVTEVRARVDTHLRIRTMQQELERHSRHLEHLVRDRTARVVESQMEMVFALVRLVNSRDVTTGNHLEHIQESCRMIANRLRENPAFSDVIDDDFIEHVAQASALHDIGKVAIPDRILLKPGPLTPDEMEIMRTHTLVGARTLQEVMNKFPGNGFIEYGAEIALYHHERWDGSGYPRGLSGDRIPLSAQIMAVVDDYDALISRRPYKKAFDRNDALGVILAGSGFHYNPLVVEAFVLCEPEIYRTHLDM
jgi:putative two-component system response regulator